MGGRINIPDEVKAAALADLATGEQPAVVAKRYGIDPAKVRVWKQRHVTDLVTPGVAHGVALQYPAVEERYLTLSDLIEQSLRAKLIAVRRLAEHVTDDAWLHKQTAADVAELFESLDRSAIGILDRLATAHRPAGDSK